MTTHHPFLARRSTVSLHRHLDLRTITGAAIAVASLRIMMWLVGIMASATNPYLPLERAVGVLPEGAPLARWLQRLLVSPMMRFDAEHYRRIVEHGYRLDNGTAAFHPLYPLLAALVRPLMGDNSAVALLVVSTVATIALCVVFARYVADVHDPALAQRATWLLLVWPPGFVLLLPYTESTFLLCAVGALWALHHRRWWPAGVLGALATLTRQQGIVLVAPMVWMLWTARHEQPVRTRNLAALLLIPLSYGLFIVYRAVVLGDLAVLAHTRTPRELIYNVLVSSTSEQIVPGQQIAWPWELFIDQLRIIPISRNSYHLVIDMVIGWVGVLVVLVGITHMTVPERWYSLGIVGLSLCYYNGEAFPYLALPRHILLAVPLFIVLARWATSRRRYAWLIQGAVLCSMTLLMMCVRVIWVP